MARPAQLMKPVAVLPPATWPLLNQIFLHAKEKLGSTTLTLGDMQRALSGGRLKAAARNIQTGECLLLRSAFWRCHVLKDELSSTPPHTVVGVSVWRRDAHGFCRVRGYVYFGYRPDFEKLYPPPAQPVKSEQRGRPAGTTVHDWIKISAQIAARCHDASGQIRIPKKLSSLANEICLWCQSEFGIQPDIREVQRAVQEITKVLKTKRE